VTSQGWYSLSFAGNTYANCQLKCSAPGFASTIRKLEITGPEPLSLSIQLAIAVAQESVGVQASVPPWRETLDLSYVRQTAARDVGEAMTEIASVNKIRKGGIDNALAGSSFARHPAALQTQRRRDGMLR